ncbi:GYD domain-containing protein [Bacteroidota bacterium]
MATFVMFGQYTPDALDEINTNRTVEAVKLIKNYGGVVKSMHALLGEHDLIFILELPNISKAMEVSIALYKLTGITFSTSAALEIEAFDAAAS